MRAKATWETQRRGNDGYIRETITLPDGTMETNVYIVPVHTVPSVLAGRRKILNHLASKGTIATVADETTTIPEPE